MSTENKVQVSFLCYSLAVSLTVYVVFFLRLSVQLYLSYLITYSTEGESRANAIFATQEVISSYLGSGSKVYMCLHNLQKTFDLVEYPVLLKKLLEAGVNGKMWRLLKNWYECSCGR